MPQFQANLDHLYELLTQKKKRTSAHYKKAKHDLNNPRKHDQMQTCRGTLQD